MFYTAVGNGSGKSYQVQQGSSANAYHVGVAVDTILIDGIDKAEQQGQIIFHTFPAADGNNFRGQLKAAHLLKIMTDLLG